MHSRYSALPYKIFAPSTTLRRPVQQKEIQVTPDDSARLVMTDFEQTVPITELPTLPLPEANDRMITYGVRLLFVTKNDDTILGLITASDILGERPIKYIQKYGGSFNEITVNDVMTRRSEIEAISFNDLCNASVGQIIETMKMFNRQHALVIEEIDDNAFVRGLLSTTRIGQQLGINIEPSNRARTFQELESALMSAA
ncbi:MAG: CBS domain-containing protein [Gammaproteobacteria bacterium]|nr:CBS domain-containing protein [Gammaproteobacteria bacterium]